MSAPTLPNNSRRHDKPQWASWWWAMMCALLMVAPAHAVGSMQQTRQMCAPHQAVFSWLERASETDSQTRAAVLQTLCQSAGLDALDTANILHSYQQWSQSQRPTISKTRPVVAALPASTCSASSRIALRKTRFFFASRDLPHTGRAAHSLAVCYLE